MYEFDWSFLWSDIGLLLLQGLLVTVKLAAMALLFAVPIGVLVGTARWAGGRVVRATCGVYVEFIRNTPPIVQILFWYFSASFILPKAALDLFLDIGLPFAAAVVALSLYHGAFMAEVFRAGFNSIHLGQMEAARTLGLSFPRAVRLVMFPQVLRVIRPPMVNEVVALVKGTSLAIAVGVPELSYAAKYIDSYYFRGVEALFAATVLYLLVCLGISRLQYFMGSRSQRSEAYHELG